MSADLFEAIKKHWADRGHERCWENDAALYRAAGLEPGVPQLPPIEEHRLECDKYRASLYGLPMEKEPAALLMSMKNQLGHALTILARWMKINSRLLNEFGEVPKGIVKELGELVEDTCTLHDTIKENHAQG